MSGELEEAVGRREAIIAGLHRWLEWDFPTAGQEYQAGADAILTALASYQERFCSSGAGVPCPQMGTPTPVLLDGHKVVPQEPTREMWAAMGNAAVAFKGPVHHDRVSAAVWEAGYAAAPSQTEAAQLVHEWKPTHRHVKRGTEYEVIGTASLQAGEPVGEAASLVVYRGENGRLWARPEVEFDDGRFISLPAEAAVARPQDEPKSLPIQTGEKP